MSLGEANVHWNATYLDCISEDAFNYGVQTLGEVNDYSFDQLAALRNKVIEVLYCGQQMGGVEKGFPPCLTV